MNRTNSSYVLGATPKNHLRVGLKWAKNGTASHAGLKELQAYISNKTALMEERMGKSELLDHFAIHAMKAQIEKMGITNPFSTAQTAYRMATEMLEHRDRILREWQREQEMHHKQQNSDIKDLDLPIRYHRCLVSEQILMKQDLCNWTEREMRRIPNLGTKGLQFVKEAMAMHGLKFKGQENA